MEYTIFFVEIRYYDASHSWQSHNDKSVPITTANDDEEAIVIAKAILADRTDPLVVQRIPTRLVRTIPVESWT